MSVSRTDPDQTLDSLPKQPLEPSGGRSWERRREGRESGGIPGGGAWSPGSVDWAHVSADGVNRVFEPLVSALQRRRGRGWDELHPVSREPFRRVAAQIRVGNRQTQV